jgi:hypothetical protein
MLLPLPLAMRARRLPLITLGFLRSSGVMLLMMASMPLNASSGMSMFFKALPTPGIMPMRSFMFPIFLI